MGDIDEECVIRVVRGLQTPYPPKGDTSLYTGRFVPIGVIGYLIRRMATPGLAAPILAAHLQQSLGSS